MKNITDDIDLYRTFWISSQGETTGPFTLEQIAGLWKAGRIYAAAQVCEEGSEQWFPVTTLRRDFPDIMRATSAAPVMTSSIAKPATQETHTGIYRVLAILLGQLGIHNFYAGEMGKAFAKIGLLLTATGFWLAGDLWLMVSATLFLGLVILILIDIVEGPTK